MLWGLFGAGVFALVAIGLAAPRLVSDLAVAITFMLILPVMIHGLTVGRFAAWFASLHHRPWWVGVYIAAFVAIAAPRLGWPTSVSLLFGSLALAATVWLLVRRRAV
jgi:hypothetical protein